MKEIVISTPLNVETQSLPNKANKVLKSIEPLYNSKRRIIREHNLKILVLDSGGFQILMDTGEMPDPKQTAKIMESFKGLKDNDLRMQLDIPPNFFEEWNTRKTKLDQNVNYFEKQSNYHNCTPIIHGLSELEIKYSLKQYDLENVNEIAFGSYAVASTKGIPYFENGKQVLENGKPVLKSVSSDKVFTRIGSMIRALRKYDKPLFALGAGSNQLCHIVWASGCKWTDGASWRTSALNHQIMLVGKTKRGVGKSPTATFMKDEDWADIDEYRKDSDYPFYGYSLNEIKEALIGDRNKFQNRASHNVYVMLMEERIANQWVGDPDGYHKYLLKRYADQPNRYWLNRYKLVKDIVLKTHIDDFNYIFK